jgi:uncharacterized Zn-binding protein involved in type VI secretion
MLKKALLATALVAAAVAGSAAAGRDPLAGVWVAHDTAGDGSTDLYIFSAPHNNGVRNYVLADSYGTWCEAPEHGGRGSPLIARGSATLDVDGTTVTLTIDRWACGNGAHGVFDEPLVGTATLTESGLDLGSYVALPLGR